MTWSATPAARLLGVSLSVAGLVTGCSSEGSEPGRSAPGVDVVSVAAQPCSRPLERSGFGSVVDRDLVLTAGHVVEGRLRALSVDGRPGTVVASDPGLDLALVEVAGLAPDATPVSLGDPVGPELELLRPAGSETVSLVRTVRLTVTDHTDDAEYRRRAHVIDVVVAGGTSGAPLVERGVLVGVVNLAADRTGVSYAVAAADLGEFVASAPRRPSGSGDSGEC